MGKLASRIMLVVPELRKHPQLEQQVPYMSKFLALSWLRLYADGCAILFIPSDVSCRVITASHRWAWGHDNEKIVTLDEVADTVYEYITSPESNLV
jgi:hypothetical protein